MNNMVFHTPRHRQFFVIPQRRNIKRLNRLYTQEICRHIWEHDMSQMTSFRSYFPILYYHSVLDSITRKYNIENRCSSCSPQNSGVFFKYCIQLNLKNLFSYPYKDSYGNEKNPAEEREMYTIYDWLIMQVRFTLKKNPRESI